MTKVLIAAGAFLVLAGMWVGSGAAITYWGVIDETDDVR